jgi:EpsD family peptidyl-prolyl cis-trans isomerase
MFQPKFILAIMFGFALTACGDKAGDKNSQSIVRVNKDEITIHQVNFQMQNMQVNEKNKDEVAKQVISGLVDRQLLVQEALKAELDRNPQVMQALEEGRMQLLAKAYLESKVASATKPSESEIADYRNKHPELFENRKLYAIEELNFVMDSALDAELDQLSNQAKTLEEVTAWLDSKQVKYARNKAARAAEAIPPNLIEKLNQLNNGEMLFVRGPNGYSVARLLETKAHPIGVAESTPIITRILLNEKQKAIATAEMERLRKASQIVYLDKKYEAKQQVSGTVKSPNQTENASGNTANVATPKTEESQSNSQSSQSEEKKVDASVEKGLSGL